MVSVIAVIVAVSASLLYFGRSSTISVEITNSSNHTIDFVLYENGQEIVNWSIMAGETLDYLIAVSTGTHNCTVNYSMGSGMPPILSKSETVRVGVTDWVLVSFVL